MAGSLSLLFAARNRSIRYARGQFLQCQEICWYNPGNRHIRFGPGFAKEVHCVLLAYIFCFSQFDA